MEDIDKILGGFVPVTFAESKEQETKPVETEGDKHYFKPEKLEEYFEHGKTCYLYHGDALDLAVSPKFKQIGEKEFLVDDAVKRGKAYFGKFTRHVYVVDW